VDYSPADDQELSLLFHLGLMIREAATLEVLVESTARHLDARENPRSVRLSGAAMAKLLKEIPKIAEAHPRVDSGQWDALAGILARVSEVNKVRNAYVHGAWTEEPNGTWSAFRGKRGERDFIGNVISKDQMVEMIDEIRSITSALADWLVVDLNRQAPSAQ
jgi:hypothetical protein